MIYLFIAGSYTPWLNLRQLDGDYDSDDDVHDGHDNIEDGYAHNDLPLHRRLLHTLAKPQIA